MTAPDPSLEAAETAFRDVLVESPARAAVLLVDIHPADAVEWLRDTEDRDRSMVFGALSPTCQASILEHADEALTQELIAPLDARLRVRFGNGIARARVHFDFLKMRSHPRGDIVEMHAKACL